MRSVYRLLLGCVILVVNLKSIHYVTQLRRDVGLQVDKQDSAATINPPRSSVAEFAREEARTGQIAKSLPKHGFVQSHGSPTHEYGSGNGGLQDQTSVKSSFLLPTRAYSPTGGRLPTDGLPHYPDPSTWRKIDNGTCIDKANEPVLDWQKRAPHAILLGTMKGGTHALNEYLWEHPQIAAPLDGVHELHFYDGKHFTRDESGIPQRKNQMAYAQRVQARYPSLLAGKSDMYAIHDSPRYLLWSDRIPDAIMCVTPWAKLMAVLRDPVQRAISHYRFQDEARRKGNIPMVDWEKWVYDDLRLLRKAGVLQDWTKVDFDEFSGSAQELLAWKTYLRNASSQMIIGRGLYTLQIEQYFSAMDRTGKPRSDFLAVRSEELRSNTQEVFDSVLEFLELPSHHLGDFSARHETGKNVTEIPPHLKKELEDLFTPYNQRLYKLLGWEDVWEYS